MKQNSMNYSTTHRWQDLHSKWHLCWWSAICFPLSLYLRPLQFTHILHC